MIGAPPSEAGGVQPTVAMLSPGAAVTPVGAPGTTAGAGVIAADAVESDPVPTPLIAATLNVYVVPLLRPRTV